MAGIVLGRKSPFVPDLPEQPTEDLGDKLTDGGILSDTQFGKGLDAGIDQTQGLGGALKATVGSAIGNEEWVESGLAYYRKKMQDAANVGANVTSVEEIDSFGDFTDWAGYTLGTLVPDVVGGGVAGVAAKAGAKKLLKNKLEQEADTIGKRLAEKAVQKNYDAAAGFVGYSAAQNTAANFAEIYEETGIEAPGKALAVGVAQGALDQFGVPQRAFKRMFGNEGLQQFNDDIAERVFMSKDYIMAVSREAVKAAGVEGFTEATQEFLGRAAVAWAEESLPPEQQREFLEIVADERSKSMYINAFAAGSLAGLVGGGTIEATRLGGGSRESGPEGGQTFNEDEEQARINRMPEARRKVIELTQAETTIDPEAGPTPEPTPGTVALTPEETTIQSGQDPSMDILLEGYDRPPAEPMLYWGNMPVPLQKQLIVDGVEDDIATEADLRAAADKLEGPARTSALNAIDASVSRSTRRAVPKQTQQTDEFSGEIFMVSTPETLNDKIASFNDTAQRGPMPKPTGDGEFVSQGVTEADINFNITPSQRPVFMGTEDGRTVQLPGLTDFVGSTDPTANPALEEAASIYLDLAMRGMPKEFRDLVKGTHVLSTEDIPHDADAAFLDRSSVIGMRFDHLLEGANDEQRARRNRFNTAHEVMHAADFKNGYSAVIDHFKMKVEDIDGDGQPDISMGRAIEEIFDLWESDAEGSGFFAYPLDSLYDDIAKHNGDPEKIQGVLDAVREELFAQLGAAYVANEGTVQKSLPFGHSIIEDIFANPVPAEQLVTNDVRGLYGNQEANQEAPASESAGVLRDIRTPAEPGGVQVQDEGGAGGTGGPSLVEKQASESVGGTPEPEAGDSTGQVLPVGRTELRDSLLQNIPEDGISAAQLSEQVGQEEGNFRDLLDQMEEDGDILSELTPDGERYFPASSDPQFIKKGAEYLLQNSRGKTTGKASVTKAINPKNAAKQIPALQALSDRHDDPLSSPAAWLRFERDLTGSNTTIRPPHGLISLYNDMDTWVATHSRLSDQQVQAAREGLETASEMGELYASGDATPDITGKLMLWGIMSRMLTASAQEAGFVDLLTKMPGAKDDPAGDIIQKTLDGTMTEQDVKSWEKAVKRLIPEGSFGRSGTSNANDWAKFMLKMSERTEDGRSKLEELHDLVGDRSISTVDVRRQFQGMINNPGIGNKVFSFLMLMTGRDDVVILDRIQLNSMWDAGRYGKLIYDDIADEFDKGHGLARYEALEKSLNQRIKELYRRLGREDEGSVGRYHWESWVLNSGQVVAHPTMKGLLDDARGADAPYADMGAPEGKMNLYRYGAIYARDTDGKPYFLYADQSNKPYRFTPEKFSEFLDQIKLRKRNIIPKGFKVSEYDKGFPWYEADGVNRENLDALIREYAEREAVESDYAVEEVDLQDETDGAGQPERERLTRQRAPKLIASAVPGVDRGFAFPEDTPIESLIEYNNAVVEAITDDDGQVPFLKEMGLPHDIEVGSGSFTGYEPSISIRLLGATLEQANQIAPVLGDALLQDAVITAQPVNKDEGMPAFLVEKADGSDFSQEEGRSLTERINPEKDPGGINFNQPLPNALVFIDPEVFNSETYTEDADAAFYDRLSAALGDGYNIESLSQDGGYFEHTEYGQAVEAFRDQEGLSGSSNLQSITRDTLYEPVRKVYEEYRAKLGGRQEEVSTPRFIRRTNPKPAAFRDEDLRAIARETAVTQFENSGIEPGELVADINIQDLVLPPSFRRLLRALERDDYLGFDRIDDVMLAVFDEDIDDFDPSPGLKSAIGRYLNDTTGVNDDIVPVSSKTIPAVAKAYKQLQRGDIDINEYVRVVGSTVKPYTAVPDPASVEQMRDALQKNQKDLIDVPISEGAMVGLRLDIPAYTNHNVWVPTIHEERSKSHRSTARVVGALFKAAPNTSRKIMEGDMSKVTYARIMGNFVNKTPEQNYNDAVAALNDPQWTQVGMDPRRREGFYDRSTMDPIISAEEVIQVGPLVLAKNVVRGDINKARYHRREEQADTHDITFNLDDEYLVNLDLEQRFSRNFPSSVRKSLVDKIERLKELENRMAASQGLERLPASVSAYDAENLMHSKVQNQIEKFEDDYIKPIAALMKAANLDDKQVGLYLLAKHAPERNRVIAEREREMRAQQIEQLNKALEDSMGALDRPVESITERLDRLENEPLKFQETGSGLTDEQAESVIATAKLEDKYDALEEIAGKVYDMLTDMRQNMVDKGLLDEDTREDWEERYEFYVPLKGFAATEQDGNMVAGNGAKGFSIKGKESFKAKGRITMPENPLLNSFIDGETKIVRAERNVIAQRLLKLLSKFKSDQWSVYPPTQYPFQSPPDDISVRKSRSQMANELRPDDSTVNRYIQVKRDGQDHFIEIRDRELNRQLQSSSIGIFNSDIESLNRLTTGLRMFQNFRRNMYINYNPTWGAVNPVRDVQTGIGYLLAEQDSRAGRLKGKKIIKNVVFGYPSAWKALWRDARGWEPKTDEARELAQYVQDYKDDGAPTGMAYTKDLDEQARRIKRLMNEGSLKKAFKAVGKLVEDWNQVMENVTRFSTYVEARKAGVERTTAATVAKDLTVNFNRKGELSGTMDTFFLFFNAAIQGNVNTVDPALKAGRKGEKITAARTVIAGLVMFGFARTLMNIWMSGEDEDGESTYLDYNEYAQKTGMLFRINDEQGFALPKAYGWGFYDDLGRLGAELAMNVKEPDAVAVDLLTSMDRHFNPQGIHAVEDRDAAETATLKLGFLVGPDVADFMLEQAANINYFGENIEVPQNSFLTPTPASQKTRRGTADWIESTTKTIAQVSGGSDYRDGKIEINPDRVQHALDFMFGGMGRFVNDAADTAHKYFNDRPDDLKPDDIPIFRTFFPRPSAYKDRVTFYDARNEWSQYWDEYSDANRAEKAALREQFGVELYQFDVFHKQAESALRKLSKQKKALEEAEGMDPILRYTKLDEIADKQELIYDKYNKRWNEIKP